MFFSLSFKLYAFAFWLLSTSTFVQGLERRATPSGSPTSCPAVGSCSAYGICSYTSPNADVVIGQTTCATCNTACSSDSQCKFAYFAPTETNCYIWYTAFNPASVQDCFSPGTGPYYRVGVGCSSSSSTTTKSSSTSSTQAASSSSVPITKTSSSTTITSSVVSSLTSTSTSSSTSAAASGTYTVQANILVIATDSTTSYSATSGLNAHGIPYTLVLVPSGGASIPALNSSSTNGNFGGIIILNEPTGITKAQWTSLYNYQIAFGVRMARLNADPSGGVDGSTFGTIGRNSDSGCCAGTGEQLVYFSDTSAFPKAGLIQGATRSTVNIWHVPASITNATLAKQIAGFGPSSDGKFKTNSTAAVINDFGNRQQMVWFIEWATLWSTTSNFLMHAHINWITRGLYVGQRRIIYNTQIDDLFLETGLYSPSGAKFRVRGSDLDAHVTWQANLNSRLPAGSNFMVEMAFNGNGNVEWAILNDTNKICQTTDWIEYTGTNYVPANLEYKKPLGTGTSIWPTSPSSFVWTLDCLKLDSLLQWFIQPASMAAFAHLSHTFTHENEDNITYADALREIQFNQAWLSMVGISSSPNFSPQGLVPPAITGLHNGDSLRAWSDSGLKFAVGDSSRPLFNANSEYWPYVTTVAADGYDGFYVIPRWVMPVYYDCDKMACNLIEWKQTAGGSGVQSDLISSWRETWTKYLLSLHQYPFMLHQANLRYGDTQQMTIGPVSGQLSLEMAFTETIIQELTRLTTWPVVFKTHDVIGQLHVNRMLQDLCKPQMSYTVTNGKIVGASLKAGAGSCSVPIPVTFPVSATASTSYTSEQLGSDPLSLWTTVGSGTATFTLSQPITL